MKFKDIQQGTQAREPIELEIAGAKVTVDMRKLSIGERDTVLREARAAARMRNVENPRDGDALYDLQIKVRTLAIALVDPESAKEKPEPYFESADQILTSPILGDDVIEYAFARWEHFADANGFYKKRMSIADITEMLKELGGADENDPLAMARAASKFCELSPAMQLHFALYTARLLWSSLQSKSSSSPPSSTELSTPSPTTSDSAEPSGAAVQ